MKFVIDSKTNYKKPYLGTAMTSEILVIGHTDSGRSSGFNQDAHIITELGGRPHAVITAIKATLHKDSKEAPLIQVSPEHLRKQMEVCMETHSIHAGKIGYLGTIPTIETVSALIAEVKKKQHFPVVLDPMILGVNRSRMYDKPTMDTLKRDLFILADIIVPSVAEGEALTGMEVQTMDDLRHMADMLLTLGPKAVYVRGAQFEKGTVVDILATDSTQLTFTTPILRAFHNENADKGSITSAGIAIGLAHNWPYTRTIEHMLNYIRQNFLEDL